MNITLTRVPIGSLPKTKSFVRMLFRLQEESGASDWITLFSTLSRGDCITVELSSLVKHPFCKLSQISVEVRHLNKTSSNMKGTLTNPPKVSSITLRFISARVNGEFHTSFADALREGGWVIS